VKIDGEEGEQSQDIFVHVLLVPDSNRFRHYDPHPHSPHHPPMTLNQVSYLMLTQTGDIMSDWRTAQLLGVSPRSMLKAQLFGALLGPCFTAFGYHVYMSLPPNESPPSRSYPAPTSQVE
jgi:hypothetical protein